DRVVVLQPAAEPCGRPRGRGLQHRERAQGRRRRGLPGFDPTGLERAGGGGVSAHSTNVSPQRRVGKRRYMPFLVLVVIALACGLAAYGVAARLLPLSATPARAVEEEAAEPAGLRKLLRRRLDPELASGLALTVA